MLHTSDDESLLFVVRALTFSHISQLISLDNTILITSVVQVQNQCIWLGVAHMSVKSESIWMGALCRVMGE